MLLGLDSIMLTIAMENPELDLSDFDDLGDEPIKEGELQQYEPDRSHSAAD